MITEARIFSLISIAQKARAVAAGNFLVERSIRSGEAKLVIISEDASGNTRDDLSHITYHYEIPTVTFGTKDTLGHTIGKESRVCIAITDAGLAKKIAEGIQQLQKQ